MGTNKKRFDYTKLGLSKVENVVTFNGHSVADMPEVTKTYLINYGFFAKMSRSLATTKDKPYTEDEMKAILTDTFNDLMAGDFTKKSSGIASNEAKLAEVNSDIANLANIMELAKDKVSKTAIGKMIDGKKILAADLQKKINDTKAKKAESTETK